MTNQELMQLPHSEMIKLIDEGKLIYLPCKVGDIIIHFKYVIGIGCKPVVDKIIKIEINKKTTVIYTKKFFYPIKLSENILEPVEKFPDTYADLYVGTEKEAEKALKELENNGK